MSYTELLGSIAFFSFLGVLLSIALHCFFETKTKRQPYPDAKRFWKRFALYSWTVVLACGISTFGWLVFSMADWIGMLNE